MWDSKVNNLRCTQYEFCFSVLKNQEKQRTQKCDGRTDGHTEKPKTMSYDDTR